MVCLIEHLLSPGLSSLNSVFQRLLSVTVCLFSQEESPFCICCPGCPSTRTAFWSPLVGQSYDGPRKMTCGAPWRNWERQCFQEIGTSLLVQDKASEASIQLLHPSILYFLWMPGFWDLLLAEGPRTSAWWFLWWFSAFLNHHRVTIRVGWWEPKAALKFCGVRDLKQEEDLFLSLLAEATNHWSLSQARGTARCLLGPGLRVSCEARLELEAMSRRVGNSSTNTPSSAASNVPLGHGWKLLWIPGIDAL